MPKNHKKFDLKEALTREANYKKTGDIVGILNICYQFWNFNPQGYRYSKICYYLGRLQLKNELVAFIENNQVEISFFVDFDFSRIGNRLFEIGLIYPNLDNQDYFNLEELYTNSEYYDLLEDILFDQEKLSLTLKKYHNSSREKRQKDFSQKLKEEIFASFIYNCKVADSNYDELFYYDRSLNTVVKLTDEEGLINGIHFHIDFFLKLDIFSTYINNILGNSFFKYYIKNMFDNGDAAILSSFRGLDNVTWKIFERRLIEFSKIGDLPINSKGLLINKVVEEWLKKIN